MKITSGSLARLFLRLKASSSFGPKCFNQQVRHITRQYRLFASNKMAARRGAKEKLIDKTKQGSEEKETRVSAHKRKATKSLKGPPPKKQQQISLANAKTQGTPLHSTATTGKKEFTRHDVVTVNLIQVPSPFFYVDQVEEEIARWKSERGTYKGIVSELGKILLSEDEDLDADLTEVEARLLFPSDDPARATRLTSALFLRIINNIASDNEVEWLAELHHPIQSCFKEFFENRESVLAESFGNAVIAQTHIADQRLKPDRVFGWSGLTKVSIQRWVGSIQFPFLVIESKPASKDGQQGDTFKMYILEAKAYEHQEDCLDIYDISPEHKTTICLPLVFGIYMVGSKFTFDVYRVVGNVKMPLTFAPIDYKTHPKRILRAIIAIKRWARELRENMITIDRTFKERGPGQKSKREKRDNNNNKNNDDESDRGDTDYQDEDDQGDDDSEQGEDDQGEEGQDDDAGDEEEDSADQDSESEQDQEAPSDAIDLHQSSKTSVMARFDKRRGLYVVDKTTVAEDGVREAELLKGPLKSLSFVPRLLGLVDHANDTTTLTMSWHSGQHPESFTQHRDLKIFIKTLLKHVSQIHKRGIIHNDLKEANVLWDSNSLMIIDFGGADQYPSYSTIGTHCYMAPEYPRVPVSDVYSCGVMFFNLLLNFKLSTREQVSYLRRCNSVQDIEEQILPFLPVSLSLWHSASWDLAKRMTHPISTKRITIKKTLNHPYLN